MTTQLMRFLDGTLGFIVVTLAALFARKPKKTVNTVKNILFIKCFGIGSIQIAGSLICAVRNRYPSAKVSFLTFSQNADFVNLMPEVDEVLPVRTSNLLFFCCDTLKHVAKLHSRGTDIVIDLEFFSKYSTLVSFLSGAGMRLGYALPAFWRHRLVTHSVIINSQAHIIDCMAQFAEILGCRSERKIMPLTVSEQAKAIVHDKLEQQGRRQDAFLAVINVNAGATSLLRRWPAQNFAAVSEALSETCDLAFIGTSGEKEYVDSVLSSLSVKTRAHAFNLAGSLKADELVALLSSSNLVVTNDSGPLHLAAGAGCRTISFFGPESPHRYGPLGEGHTVFYAGELCSPCISIDNGKRSDCRRNCQCLRAIEPDAVIKAAKKMLQK